VVVPISRTVIFFLNTPCDIPFFGHVRKLAIFLFLLFPALIMAQHPSYWTLNHEQGLPSLKVYDLMEDSLGVIWIGTSEGLVHYDGLDVQVLRSASSRSEDRSIIKRASTGSVWCMNFSGEPFLADYDTILPAPQVLEGLDGKILALEPFSDSLLVLTKLQLAVYHKSMPRPRIIASTTPDNQYLGNVADSLLLTMRGVLHLRSGTVDTVMGHIPSHMEHDAYGIYRYFKEAGTVQLRTPNGYTELVRGLRREGRPIPLTVGVRSNSTGTWILTFDGAYLVEKQQWLFPGTPVSDVIEAQDGSLWFSTLTNGVKVVPDLKLIRYSKEINGLPTERFNRMCELPDGQILASDNNGLLIKLHPEKGVVATFRAPIERESEALHVDTVNGRVLVAFGNLYLLDLATLQLLDTEKGNFKSLAVSNNFIHAVHGTMMQRIPYDGNRLGDALTILDRSTEGYAVVERGGTVWWATNKGLMKGDGSVVELTATEDSKKLFRNIALLKDGSVIVSGPPDSLAVVSADGEKVRWMAIPENISRGRRIRAMMVHADELFVMMSDGIGIMNLNDAQQWRRSGSESGLPTTDLRDLLVTDDRLWVASFNGLYVLELSNPKHALPPTVLLRKMMVNGVRRMATDQMQLPHNENDIELVLRGISPRSRGQIRFHYRLTGLMTGFEQNQSGNILQFRALPPGSYSLEVYAEDANGTRSEQPLRFSFSIQKPWYNTWPFYIAVALAIITSVSLLFMLRIRFINQRNLRQLENSRLKEDLRASQLTALRAQMNPHFMFNVLNSVQGLFTIGKTEKANEVLSRFSDLMRSVLDVSDQNSIGLDRELELIGLYLELEAVRFGDDFEYSLTVDPKIDPTKLSVPSLLIQPYVENAVKHGLLHRKGQKQLSVSLTTSQDGAVLIVRIDDNGVGRERSAILRSKKHRSFATEASLSRVDLLNVESEKKITVSITDKKDLNGNALGTLVELRIPIR
jgi:hypothetical protein